MTEELDKMLNDMRTRIQEGEKLSDQDIMDLMLEDPATMVGELNNSKLASEEATFNMVKLVIKYGQTAALISYINTVKYILDVLAHEETDNDMTAEECFMEAFNAVLEDLGWIIIKNHEVEDE